MKNKTLTSILIFTLTVSSLWFMYNIAPTKAEVEKYFEENKCIICSGEQYGEVYWLRRNTAMLWGQIFRIPSWWTPKVLLYTTTPFNYYNEITHEEDEWHAYTWVDTKDGRFVYNAVKGEFVKEIDAKVDPAMKWNEDMKKLTSEMQKEQAEKSNKVICDTNTYNCDAFNTHAEAQEVFEACGGTGNDIHHLDRDADGVACESLP